MRLGGKDLELVFSDECSVYNQNPSRMLVSKVTCQPLFTFP